MRTEYLARPEPLAINSAMGKRILDSEKWIAQEKVDGWRAMWDGKRLWSRHGRPLDAFFKIRPPSNVVLDGELCQGRYVVFDLLAVGGEELRSRPLSERWMRLCMLPVETVRWVLYGKLEIYKHWLSRGAEGMVLKQLGDAYPPEGGAVWFKVKP